MRTAALFLALFLGLLLVGARPDPAYQTWRARLKASSISLVYAAQFGGNPASYMGHLFLKVRSKARGAAGNQTVDLMDQTFGFVALVPEGTNSVAYALKGLFGGFEGGFVSNDFYKLSYEYQSLESRDLWEFEVAFSEAETERFLEVLWERMHAGPFTYRFFDGNCAWMIGDLLWAVRPDIAESPGRPGLFTTPHDVVRWLAAHGLIRAAKAYPSQRAQYLARLDRLEPAERDRLDLDFRARAVPDGRSFAYYDALVARYDYEEAKAKRKFEPEGERARAGVLRRLANATLPTAGAPDVQPESNDPRAAHPLTLALLAAGRSGASAFADLEIRPAGHDLLDPAAGFSDDMGIAFVSGRLRYDGEAHLLRLRQLDLMRMKNLAPLTPLDRDPAWAFRTGLYDEGDPRFRRGYYGTAAALGASTALLPRTKGWALVGGAARYALVERRGEAGPTVELGMLAHPVPGLRFVATSEAILPFVIKGRRQELERTDTVGVAVAITDHHDVRIEVTAHRQRPTEGALAYGRYF